jgi:hypothetical protein
VPQLAGLARNVADRIDTFSDDLHALSWIRELRLRRRPG